MDPELLKLGPKGLGRSGVYATYSIGSDIWFRREQGYLSAQASTDRKPGRLSLPFYSMQLFGGNILESINFSTPNHAMIQISNTNNAYGRSLSTRQNQILT